MRLLDKLRLLAAGLMLERPARGQSYDEIAAQLDASGKKIDASIAAAKDQVRAQKLLRHISGIERWGQSRLVAFLGEPLKQDEYDDYRPGTDLSTEEQRAYFQITRQETINIVHRLAAANLPDDLRVAHNSFGPLSPRAWLRYLDTHASLESKKLR